MKSLDKMFTIIYIYRSSSSSFEGGGFDSGTECSLVVGCGMESLLQNWELHGLDWLEPPLVHLQLTPNY